MYESGTNISNRMKRFKISVTREGLEMMNSLAKEGEEVEEQNKESHRSKLKDAENSLKTSVKNLFKEPAKLIQNASIISNGSSPFNKNSDTPFKISHFPDVVNNLVYQNSLKNKNKFIEGLRSLDSSTTYGKWKPLGGVLAIFPKRDMRVKVKARLKAHNEDYKNTIQSVKRRAEEKKSELLDPILFRNTFKDIKANLMWEKNKIRNQAEISHFSKIKLLQSAEKSKRTSSPTPKKSPSKKIRLDLSGSSKAIHSTIFNQSKIPSTTRSFKLTKHYKQSNRSKII